MAISKELNNEDYKANKFTALCLYISFIVGVFLWFFNLADIFIVEDNIFKSAIISASIITLLTFILLKFIGYNNPITKYILIFLAVCMYTAFNITLTYHTVLTLIFPIIYSVQYENKKVVVYAYVLSAIGATLGVIIGYNVGLCDANMALLTTTNTEEFLRTFRDIEVPEKVPYSKLILFYAFIRCISLLAIVPVIYKISVKLNNKTKDLIESNEKNTKMQNDLVLSLASIIASRDETTGNHVRNSSKYASFLVNKLVEAKMFQDELTDDYAELVKKAAILHDIGKVKVPDAILCKNGKLTDEEYAEMKKHTIYGKEIMKSVICNIENSEEYLDIATKMAVGHHERWDGRGYPYGISGENIPLCARIMAVADVLDALLSKRQYKKEFSFEETYEIMSKEYDKQFDGRILKVLFDNWSEFTNNIYNYN